jgi:hypothetical protein
MTWDELLEEYRALGGIAENVRLGNGPLGRGIFPIDPQKPVKLLTPVTMLVRTEDVVIHDGELTVPEARYDARVRAFFENYQRYFGWGAGGREYAFTTQTAWHALPPPVGQSISAMFANDRDDARFLPPTEQLTLIEYLSTRQFRRGDGLHIAPLLDLVNHDGEVPGYMAEGCSVEGTFAGEVLVRYSGVDTLAFAVLYSFAPISLAAFSVGATVGLPDGRRLSIARDVRKGTREGDVVLPEVRQEGDTVELTYLALGVRNGMDLPRAIFRKVMQRVGVTDSDHIFDAIVNYNQTRLIALLRQLRGEDSSLARMLEDGIINQLETLSACIGARALP